MHNASCCDPNDLATSAMRCPPYQEEPADNRQPVAVDSTPTADRTPHMAPAGPVPLDVGLGNHLRCRPAANARRCVAWRRLKSCTMHLRMPRYVSGLRGDHRDGLPQPERERSRLLSTRPAKALAFQDIGAAESLRRVKRSKNSWLNRLPQREQRQARVMTPDVGRTAIEVAFAAMC